jgi:hypothetical protein
MCETRQFDRVETTRNEQMLEQAINDLIKAINANTAALTGGRATAPATTAATGRTAAAGAKTGFTAEMVKAAVVEVRDTLGKPAALRIIKTAGRAAELVAIKEANYAAVMKACADVMREAQEGADEGDGAEEDSL